MLDTTVAFTKYGSVLVRLPTIGDSAADCAVTLMSPLRAVTLWALRMPASVVEEMRRTIARVRAAVAGLPPRRVFVAEWLDPPFAAGHWVPEMVALAGGEEVLGRAGEASFATTWDDVRARSPEVVVLAPCGFDSARAAREAALPPLPHSPSAALPERRAAPP